MVGELDATISVFDEDASGRWRLLASLATSSYDDGPAYPSHIVYGDGHLYVANRTPSTISVFIHGDDTLALVGEVATGGEWPRHFAVVGNDLVVANERSHELTWLRLRLGLPVEVARREPTPSPTCVVTAG